MIHLHRLERLGNLMSQYCFARVLTGRFGYALDACPIAGFTASRRRIDGEEVLGLEVRWTRQWPREVYSSRKLERAELFQAPGARVTLQGFFQRFEYIAEIREEVREDWLKLDDPAPVRASGDFLVCLRMKDDVRDTKNLEGSEASPWTDSVLRVEEIRRLVKTVPHERLYLVTDEPGHPTIESLKDLHPVVQAEGEMQDFRFIHSFQKVAIGQSAFQWWAAFLGAAREIYSPPMDRGIWSHPEPADLITDPWWWGIDLRVPDDQRYVYEW